MLFFPDLKKFLFPDPWQPWSSWTRWQIQNASKYFWVNSYFGSLQNFHKKGRPCGNFFFHWPHLRIQLEVKCTNAGCFSGITFLRNFLEVCPVRGFSGEWFLWTFGGFSGTNSNWKIISIYITKKKKKRFQYINKWK